ARLRRHAVGVVGAGLSDRTRRAGPAATIGVGLHAVLPLVDALGRHARANHHVARVRRAIGVERALLSVRARRARAAAAIGVGLHAVLVLVDALARVAQLRDRVARARRAVVVDLALLSVRARHAHSAAAVGVGLGAVLPAIHALT